MDRAPHETRDLYTSLLACLSSLVDRPVRVSLLAPGEPSALMRGVLGGVESEGPAGHETARLALNQSAAGHANAVVLHADRVSTVEWSHPGRTVLVVVCGTTTVEIADMSVQGVSRDWEYRLAQALLKPEPERSARLRSLADLAGVQASRETNAALARKLAGVNQLLAEYLPEPEPEDGDCDDVPF